MDEPTAESAFEATAPPADERRWRRRALGMGAIAALVSGALAVMANLSEIAGWFAPDETRQLVEQARVDIRDTDAKVESLLMLLRNQAVAEGLDLDLDSEAAIRNAIRTIVASGDAQKQAALALLDQGDPVAAAERMSRLAAEQSSAAGTTVETAAETWRETGALYYGLDTERAIASYREADRLQPGNPETLEMLGLSLSRAAQLHEAEQALLEALVLQPPPAQRASILGGLGQVARQRGDYAGARAYFEQALSTAVRNRLPAERIHALVFLGGLAREQGRLPDAQDYLHEALTHAEKLEDNAHQARVLSSLGTLAAARGDYDAAEAYLDAALEIHRQRRDLGAEATAVGNLGAVALLRGNSEDAERLLLQSVVIGRELGWISSIVTDLINLGGLAAGRNDLDQADSYLLEAGDLAARHGLDELTPVIDYNRGDLALRRGETGRACQLWAAAEPRMSAMGSAHAETARAQLAAAECPGHIP